MHAPAKKGPRAANTYRGHVRNTWKAARRLPEWREQAAVIANQNANVAGRAIVANGAREAGSKALIDAAVRFPGMRRDVVFTSAVLAYYNNLPRPRPVSRIIRELEKQVLS